LELTLYKAVPLPAIEASALRNRAAIPPWKRTAVAGSIFMTIRFIGSLLCGALLLIANSTSPALAAMPMVPLGTGLVSTDVVQVVVMRRGGAVAKSDSGNRGQNRQAITTTTRSNIKHHRRVTIRNIEPLVVSPRDASSGRASGKRHIKP
jgi:hypothetical protein